MGGQLIVSENGNDPGEPTCETTNLAAMNRSTYSLNAFILVL